MIYFIVREFQFYEKYNNIENRTFYKKINTNKYCWFIMDIKNIIEKELIGVASVFSRFTTLRPF